MMRFYRALLRLYPGSFQAEYRGELCRTFEARARDFTGPFAPLATMVAALTDVVPNAIAAHWDILRMDVRYAFRSLSRTPGLAVTAVLVVALGVGANTAVFSIADFVFLRPLPFEEPSRLLKMWQGTPGYMNEVSPANYRDWRAMTSSFSALAAFTSGASNLVSHAEPRRLEALHATPELLPMLGVRPLMGRAFTAEDVATGPCVVLSHALWQSLFGGDPAVVGTVVRLDGAPHTVLGVMPASFTFPRREIEAWVSLEFRDEAYQDRTDTYLHVLGRLRPGVTPEQARQDLTVASAQLEQQYPRENKNVRAVALGLREELAPSARLLVLAMCGAALCILLLACANLASLFLARGTHRARELAMRSALGGGRDRLVRQLVTESLCIALVGGLVGIATAVFGVPVLARFVPSTLPTAAEPSVDLRLLAVAGLFVVATGLAFGLAPALRVGQITSFDALRGGPRTVGSGTQRLRAGLVVVEVTASVVLLVLSGLLIRAVWRIQAVDPGFDTQGVLTMQTALPQPKYVSTARRVQFYDRVLEEVRALPGVQSAAYATGLPMSMRGGIRKVSLPGQPESNDDANNASLRFVTPQFFATFGIPVRRGRDIAAGDRREQPFVAVVSESFVEQYWPNQDPIGQRFKIAEEERTVVGVVRDIRVRGLEQTSEPQVYVPYQQVRDSAVIGYVPKALAVRTATTLPAADLASRIRRIIQSADAEQPITNVRTLSAIVEEETASRVTQLRLLGAMTLVALLIAGLGIHGLLSFSVSKRSQEIGVRIALGAQAGRIIRMVLREGLVLALVGIAIGVAVAYAAARGMSAVLFGVRPEDPITLVVAASLCLATAGLGCLRPALRAARVDPMTAMRSE